MEKNKNIIELVQMTDVMLKEFRTTQAIGFGHICPICKVKRNPEDFVVDHQHKTKTEINGVDGAGLVRGTICFMCNSTEGRMLSKFKMSGLKRSISFQDYLRSLADYLDQPNTHYIHPREKPPAKKLGKRLFNKVNKLHSIKYPKRKALVYPKSGKLTKLFEELIKEFKIDSV